MIESAEWVSLNGRILPASDARISVFDAGFMQGVGLFETMRAYGGRVFRAAAHIERLTNSAAALGWRTTFDNDAIARDLAQLLWHAGLREARVRLTVTSGSLRAPIDDERGAQPTILISATPGGGYPEESYERGVSAVIGSYRQSRAEPLAGHKTTSYFARLAALRTAHQAGAAELLWRSDDGTIAEGSISNVFAMIDGRLVTPPLDCGILPGVTRGIVLELARALRIDATEARISVDALHSADEVMLTNSMMEILPVIALDGRAVGGGSVAGPVARRLLAAYRSLVREECEDHE